MELRRAHTPENCTAWLPWLAKARSVQKCKSSVAEMIKTFLERAQAKLEGESALEQEATS